MSEKRPDDEVGNRAEKAGDRSEDVVERLESLLDEEKMGGEEAAPELLDVEVDQSGQRLSRTERRERDLQEYRNLEGILRHGPVTVKVSEDGLIAHITRIDNQTTHNSVMALLQRHRVYFGIDLEAIQDALIKAGRGEVLYEVVVAKGVPPKVLGDPKIYYREGMESGTVSFKRLSQLFQAPSAESLHGWNEAVPTVAKGDVLAEIVAAKTEVGKNVYGEVLEAQVVHTVELEAGENTTLDSQKRRCIADVYGYAGLLDGRPVVLPPVWMSDDKMEARFVALPALKAPERAPSTADLRTMLEARWIEYGILEDQLTLISDRLSQGLPLTSHLIIAEGSPSVNGQNAQLTYTFDAFELLSWTQIQSMANTKTLIGLKNTLEELVTSAAARPLCHAAKKGDVLVEKIPASQGVMGRDIEGEEIVPEEGVDVALEVGAHVDATPDGLRCTATIFGYACLRFDQLNVVAPIWITPDRSAVYFINLRQGARAVYPSLADMQDMLTQVGVKHGFDEEKWVEVLAGLEAGQNKEVLIQVAQGTLPQPGQDAEFHWEVDIEVNKVGKVMEDGSIDFRERSLATVVREDELIGVLVPARAGIPGVDVMGEELPALPPLNIEVMTDTRVYAEEEDGKMGFYAETGGGVTQLLEMQVGQNRRHRRIRIGISPISNIDGDVDYSTGNIDFNGDVIIRGSVQSLFSVKATGTVNIGGYVEAGAFISAGVDILIKGGIVGANTELVAGAGIMAKFVQEASIRANGDVQAGAYIYNASVRTRGKVIVVGKGEGKSRALVGGLIWAGSGIEAPSIGSPYNTGTKLVAGVDPELVNRLEQVRSNIKICQARQNKMMEQVGLQDLGVEAIRQTLKVAVSPDRKRGILLVLKKITRMAELQRDMEQEIETIVEEQRQQARRGHIQVGRKLFSGVDIRIGENTTTIIDDQEQVSIRLVEKEGETTLEIGPLRG